MADNTFTSIPSKPLPPSDKAPPNNNSTLKPARVSVLKSPSDFLKNNPPSQEPQRIEGRVTQLDPQTNRALIRTSQGEFEVLYPNDRSLPDKASRVEIKIIPARYGHQGATITQIPNPPRQTDQVQIQSTQPAKIAPYQPPLSTSTISKTPAILPQAMPNQPIKILPLTPAQIPSIDTRLLTPQTVNTLPVLENSAVLKNMPTANPVISQINNNLGVNSYSMLDFAVPIPQNIISIATHSNSENPMRTSLLQNNRQSLVANPQITALFKTTPAPLQLLDLISTRHYQSQSTLLPNTQVVLSQPSIVNFDMIETASVFIKPQSLLTISTHTQQSPPSTSILNNNFTPISIPATVVGTLNGVQSVISVPSIGMNNNSAPSFFTLQNTVLPIGSTVQIPLSHIILSNTVSLSTEQMSSSIRPLSTQTQSLLQPDGWSALNELIDTIQQISPQLAQNISQIIPAAKTPAQIPPGLLLFIMALKGGDMTSWISERPADLLRNIGKSDLLSRLNADFSNISKVATEQLPNDWRGLIFPFQGDTDLQNIALFYKHDDQNDRSEKDRKQTRFIFDMDLSRMGIVQIDGLFKPFENSKRLDIVIRTETALSEPMRQMMRQNYSKILKYSDISGEILFQDQKESFIHILQQKENVELTT